MPPFDDNPEVWIGAIGGIIALITFLNSAAMALIQYRRTIRDRSVDLYNEFYSADSYRRIVAPVYRMMLKWRGFPDERRQAYMQAIRSSWTGAKSDPQNMLRAYNSQHRIDMDPDEAHFRDTFSTEVFTEHEALTAFLYFWTKLDMMKESGLISASIIKRMFCGPYCYYRDFLAELRRQVVPYLEHQDAPPWIEATERLDKFFRAS